jgi:hypothetical protein
MRMRRDAHQGLARRVKGEHRTNNDLRHLNT